VKPLAHRSILLAEDEPLIALDVSTALTSAGATAVVALDLDHVRQLGKDGGISAAILDIGLGARDCAELCDCLASFRVPFIFYTGYADGDIQRRWPNAPVLPKPAAPEQIVEALTELLAPRG